MPLAVVAFVCALLLSAGLPGSAGAQAPPQQALGSLQVTGEGYVNGLRTVGEQTVFIGDTVRTGPTGRGALALTGGALNLDAATEVFFRSVAFLATLRVGTVEVRTFQAGRSVELQFGN